MPAHSGKAVAAVALLAAGLVLSGCFADPEGTSGDPSTAPTTTAPTSTAPTSTAPTGADPSRSGRVATAGPPRFDAASAKQTIVHLAKRIGPREATSADYRRAARRVETVLSDLGYQTHRMPVRVPAGNSWGVEVPAGRSFNVIADPPDLETQEPHLLVGAHLDTVPQSPGAEDNASGVAAMLELARLASDYGTRLPVRFVAFGAEEPRGSGDDMHHFGSRAYVRAMRPKEKSNLRAMVSLDRVGVRGKSVPICTGGTGTTDIQDALTGGAGDVSTRTCEDRASDHWSFEKAGLPAARIGSIPYAGYHSTDDVPSVVSKRQLARVGQVMWRWLRNH